jgi:hypothetical protein
MKKMLCQSLIFPIFDYCDVIYFSTTDVNKRRLAKSFNSCIRFISGLKKFDHITAAIQTLKLLTPAKRQLLHLSCLTHKILQTNCPQYLKDELLALTDFHQHNTRNRDTLHIPGHRLEHFKNSMTYNCVSAWNSLPLELRQNSDTLKFSVMAKKHWLKQQSLDIVA